MSLWLWVWQGNCRKLVRKSLASSVWEMMVPVVQWTVEVWQVSRPWVYPKEYPEDLLEAWTVVKGE